VTPEHFAQSLASRGLLEDVQAIALRHAATVDELGSRSRLAHVVGARHEAMRLMRDRGLSYPAIGLLFERDHTSVMYAIGKGSVG
jgi:chromosomal replication initiation ATPase DnaA